MTSRILGVDVTEAYRAFGGTLPGAIVATGGVLAFADSTDPEKRRRMLGSLLRLVLEAPGYFRAEHDGAVVVTTDRGQRFATWYGGDPEGDAVIAVASGWEWALAGGGIPDLDVLRPDCDTGVMQ